MTEKSQACHCKVTSLSLQSHKPITEKSQACDGKVTSLSLESHKPITEKSQKGWWNLCREFVWVEALCGTLKEWCSKYVTACGGWLIGWFPPRWLIKGDQPILVLPKHVPVWGLMNQGDSIFTTTHSLLDMNTWQTAGQTWINESFSDRIRIQWQQTDRSELSTWQETSKQLTWTCTRLRKRGRNNRF